MGPKASAQQGQDTLLYTFLLPWYFCQLLSFFTLLSAPGGPGLFARIWDMVVVF